MEFSQLRIFQAVAEELSFSKAARRLRIAQPALSRAVQELEQDLSHQGLYLQGEPVGMGLYLCRNCGETMHYNHPAALIPCPACGGGHFLRRGLPV